MAIVADLAQDVSAIRSVAPLFEAEKFEVEKNDVHGSGVSWPAVFAGGLATSALCLILLALGAGFELSSISPLSTRSADLRHLGWGTIVWILLSQILGAAFGGYLAGRLRTRWTRIHGDEVHFRDTAHGFLSWALATVASAAFLTSTGSSLATGALAARPADAPAAYHVDQLFRESNPDADPGAATRLVTGRIVEQVIATGTFSSDDEAYVSSVVARTTGLSAGDARKRVADVVQRAQQDADVQRRLAARLLLWTFMSLLCGAFASSVAATIGGGQRDRVALR